MLSAFGMFHFANEKWLHSSRGSKKSSGGQRLTLSQSQFVFSPSLLSLVSLALMVSVGACCLGCLWGCPGPIGSRPPCCLPPTESCGPGSEGPAGEPSCQSQSSTLWPSPRRRAQTAGSCLRPAIEKPVRLVSLGVWATQHSSLWRDDITNLQLGQQVCFKSASQRVSPRVCSEEVRLLKDWSKFLQPLQVEFLRKREQSYEISHFKHSME